MPDADALRRELEAVVRDPATPELRAAIGRLQLRKDAAGIPVGESVHVADHRGALAGTGLDYAEVNRIALAYAGVAAGEAPQELAAGFWLEGLLTGLELAEVRRERAAAVDADRVPYVGAGAAGARRSAQIDREEAGTYPSDHPRVIGLEESALRWERQAARLEERDRG